MPIRPVVTHATPQPNFIEPDDHLANSVNRDQPLANSVINADGLSLEHRSLIKGPDKLIWERALANDLGRLTQGVGTRMPTGTSTMFSVHPSSIPKNKKVTYMRLVASVRPLKSETYRVGWPPSNALPFRWRS